MKILLTAVNAKYIHSNPAIYSLKRYADCYRDHIFLSEYTINHYPDQILQSLYKQKPDVLAFSCYIWNIGIIEEVIKEYRKLDKDVKIWVGGPEVSYDAKACMERIPELDGVMIGEGEETFLELAGHYVDQMMSLKDIKGLCYRDEDGSIVETSCRMPLDFSRLPFMYEEIKGLDAFENRIIYYETSRGCPFSCSYCLSSIDKRVRLRDMDLVKEELTLFLDKKVAQVKFIDRTFNCNKEHAMAIWQFIKEHDNGITNFHFEIAADILTEEEMELIKTMRPGLIQLEIGVQSTNPQTIKAINRAMNLEKVARNVARVKSGHNIHQHLDLIAGLPYEDYDSFAKSFNDVYVMEPDQLQLGFLKVLKGSYMKEVCEEHGIVYKSKAPYEVLYTKYLSYDDVLKLKALEDMVEVYYNSGQFMNTIKFLEHFYETPFALYEALGAFYERKGYFLVNHARIRRYEILREFLLEELHVGEDMMTVLDEVMMYDLYIREKMKTRPKFAKSADEYKKLYKEFFFDKERLKGYGEPLHLEHFTIDVKESAKTGKAVKRDYFILFDYSRREPLHGQAYAKEFDSIA